MKHYEWAEPGDPPNPDFASVKAVPLAKSVSYPPITPELERDLIRRYHEDGDLDALDWLVEAHRPMVVRMATQKWRGNGTTLKALVEYGMLGLRLAAEPRRPSLTKKGKLVGFDPSDGNRFNTYARHYAEKEMRGALTSDPPLAVKPEFEQKVTVEVASWGEPPTAEDDDPPLKEGGRILFRDSQNRRLLPRRCGRSSTLWNPTFTPPQQPRPRNYRAHPVTATERMGRDLFYGINYLVLQTYEALSEAGMGGWDFGAENSHDVDDWWLPTEGALKGKAYSLPDKVLKQRWRMGCKREGSFPFKKNAALGLFGRRGHRLPDYVVLGGKVVVIRNREFTPSLCLYPLASIYLLVEEVPL